jgi:hypothetical protein
VAIFKRTTRFGAFPALRIGNFYIVRGFHKWRFGLYTPKRVETKNGVCDLVALNLGKLMFLYETPKTSPASESCKSVVSLSQVPVARSQRSEAACDGD